MSTAVKVAIVGATGKTGSSIVNGLLASETKFDITALARPASVDNEAHNALRNRGIHVVSADLTGPKEELVKTLTGIDVVISCIVYNGLSDQIPLAEAAKEAGVKRFVPCDFSTPTTRGVMTMHDQKSDILASVQRLYLPYTVIDVGWWSLQGIPAVASGRTKHVVRELINVLPGDGTVPIAYTDLPDIGTYVAKIIVDPRTLNRKVFAYTEVLSTNQVDELVEELSGEKAIRKHLSAETVRDAIASAHAALAKDPTDQSTRFNLLLNEYVNCWGLRGDNTPEYAKYLGYLDFKELYPGVTGKTLRTIIAEVLDGKRGGE
ncbi:NAD(P)-binding protein [Annulohypoxylon maeteangense]|uniref:NAD(P)-binding protein n=1 Tax=Annulohypoxylon maeteangense TaxID=1927788 RepID=UPI002008723B|nr:NAD(P)-binding protein [Annulohypoxylon maeteangense]KAI0888538.1 NAD(P)-binding protein [Annulohypoxylon maeteangense]